MPPRLEIIRRAGKLAMRLASVAARGATAAVAGEVLKILIKHQIEVLTQGGSCQCDDCTAPAPTPTTTPESEVH